MTLTYSIVTMSPILLYASIILILTLCVLRVWRRRRIYFFAGLCEGPKSWPIVGNALQLIGNGEDLVKYISQMGNNYRGRRVFFWLFSRPLLFVQTVDDAKVILNSPQCLAKHAYYDLFILLVGHGLFTAPPLTWRHHRKLLLPAFTKRTIDSYVPVFGKHSSKFVSELAVHADQRTTVDLQKYLTKFAFRVFYETAMGLNPDNDATNDPAEFLLCMENLKSAAHDAMFNFWSVNYYTKGAGGEMSRNMDAVRDFTKNVIRAKMEEITKSRNTNSSVIQFPILTNTQEPDVDCDGLRPPRSFLDLLLDLAGDTFNEKECCDEVTTFLIGGSDTTATTIGFVLLALGMCEEIQSAVHAELDGIFSSKDKQKPVRIADLPNLAYLERVIKETMRMFPISVMIGRECNRDVTLTDGVTLPAGVGVALLVYNLHRSPDLWPRPLEFDPDRFLVSDSTQRRHPYAYLPFSAGPRNCIGAGFAMTSMKVALATLLRSYKVRTITTANTLADIRLEMSLVTTPVEGFTVQLLHRNPIDS